MAYNAKRCRGKGSRGQCRWLFVEGRTVRCEFCGRTKELRQSALRYNRLEKIKERTSTGVTNMSQADRLELTCDCGNRGSANFNAKTVEGFYVAMAGYDSITRELYLRCCNCNHQLKLNTKTREVSLLFRD